MRKTATTMAVASAVLMAGYFQATASDGGAFASSEARLPRHNAEYCRAIISLSSLCM